MSNSKNFLRRQIEDDSRFKVFQEAQNMPMIAQQQQQYDTQNTRNSPVKAIG